MNIDVFSSESVPAVSWKDKPVGTVQGGTVVKEPELVQSRDFESGEPAKWPDGNPKMSVVITLDINGEQHALWCPKPSAMFAAVGSETKKLGRGLRAGDKLQIKFTGTKPNTKNPRLNAQKLFSAKIEAGESDAFVNGNGNEPTAASTTDNGGDC